MRQSARWSRLVMAASVSILAAACAPKPVSPPPSQPVSPAPAAQGSYKVGKPYQINGTWYYPAEDYGYDESGVASWYGPNFHARQTANGEIYDQNGLTAAHRTLPMPSFVRVTNLDNGRSIILRVNDRGPYAHGRVLDVTRRAAQLLGFEAQGTAKVRVQILADESRAVAQRMRSGGTLVAAADEPRVDAAPRILVAAETLPPPGSTEKPRPIQVAAPTARPAPAAIEPVLETQQVAVVAVKPTAMYVQAGAFQRYDNASRVGAKLTGIGQIRIIQVSLSGHDMFRVRVGPLASVEEADRLLERVVQAGYPDARLIVD